MIEQIVIPNPNEKRIVKTRSICIRDLFGDRKAQEFVLSRIAESLTEAVRKMDGNCNLNIQYKNVLSRDHNPDGNQIFFVITDDSDLLVDGPFHFYGPDPKR
jgi:hypothetical protein